MSKKQFESLVLGMRELKDDVKQNISEVKDDLRQDIGDLNTLVNTVAVDLGEVRGGLKSVGKQIEIQNKNIKEMAVTQTEHGVEIGYLKKKTSHKPKSLIPSTLKKFVPGRLLIYVLIGLVLIIGFAGYLVFSYLFANGIPFFSS